MIPKEEMIKAYILKKEMTLKFPLPEREGERIGDSFIRTIPEKTHDDIRHVLGKTYYWNGYEYEEGEHYSQRVNVCSHPFRIPLDSFPGGKTK